MIRDSTRRSSIAYAVRYAAQVDYTISELLAEAFMEFGGAAQIIVYTLTKLRCMELAEYLRAAPYHADLEPEQRSKTFDAFMCGTAPVIVSTSAFGMGVNNSNVRAVIHDQAPRSISDYAQQSGRCSRDGRTGRATIVMPLDEACAKPDKFLHCYMTQGTCRRAVLDEALDGAPDPKKCHPGEEFCNTCLSNAPSCKRTSLFVREPSGRPTKVRQTYSPPTSSLTPGRKRDDLDSPCPSPTELASSQPMGLHQPATNVPENVGGHLTPDACSGPNSVVQASTSQSHAGKIRTQSPEMASACFRDSINPPTQSKVIMPDAMSPCGPKDPSPTHDPIQRYTDNVLTEHLREVADQWAGCIVCSINNRDEMFHSLRHCPYTAETKTRRDIQNFDMKYLNKVALPVASFTGCVICRMPQAICDSWSPKPDSTPDRPSFKRAERITWSCQYKDIVRTWIAALYVVDHPTALKWLHSLEAEVQRWGVTCGHTGKADWAMFKRWAVTKVKTPELKSNRLTMFFVMTVDSNE